MFAVWLFALFLRIEKLLLSLLGLLSTEEMVLDLQVLWSRTLTLRVCESKVLQIVQRHCRHLNLICSLEAELTNIFTYRAFCHPVRQIGNIGTKKDNSEGGKVSHMLMIISLISMRGHRASLSHVCPVALIIIFLQLRFL